MSSLPPRVRNAFRRLTVTSCSRRQTHSPIPRSSPLPDPSRSRDVLRRTTQQGSVPRSRRLLVRSREFGRVCRSSRSDFRFPVGRSETGRRSGKDQGLVDLDSRKSEYNLCSFAGLQVSFRTMLTLELFRDRNTTLSEEGKFGWLVYRIIG